MSQRNPMNDRYQTEERKGQTRKSAASAKPKTKAASSVRIESATKTPQQKKAAKKTQQEQRTRVDRKYYNPPTAEYKKWRKIWWILLISALALTGVSLVLRMQLPDEDVITMIPLGIGYAGVIASIIIQSTKINKIRKEYQATMLAKESKSQRALAKKEHAAAVAARKAEKEKGDEASQEAASKKGFLSFSGLRGIAQRASRSNKDQEHPNKDQESKAEKDQAHQADKKRK